MNDGFSISFVCVSLVVLLIMLVTLMHPYSCGLPELPITENPTSFGFENEDQYAILTIKADGNKFLNTEWVSGKLLFIKADTRLPFGEVRKTLVELERYRTQGIVLMAEQKIVEPDVENFSCIPCFPYFRD